MVVKEIRLSKRKGMAWLVMLFLMTFSTIGTPKEPTPQFYFSTRLIEQPQSLTPIIASLPAQDAQANVDFKFNLTPSIHVSQPELSYQFYNGSRDINHETTQLIGTSQGIVGLPNGVRQIITKPDDCRSFFALAYNKSCLLRFHVDTNTYTSVQDGSGPVVFIHMSWKWGSKQNRNGGENITVYPSQSLASILAPIMLPTVIHVTPSEQNGLRYDRTTASIIGNPISAGDYHFTVSATNGNTTTTSTDLNIRVGINPHDTPVFKQNYSLASAMPEQHYRLNLMEVIESTPGFAVTNQVRFRMVAGSNHPSWLSLDKETSTILQGQAPSSDAGQIKEVTLIATSNTGGDSLPMTIHIPVAFDLEKRPVIEKGIKLYAKSGDKIHNNLRTNIFDSTTDSSLKLILDNIEPAAPWLSISISNPTAINGSVPKNAVGQLYQLTLHANNAIGGNSDSVTIPLQISIDETKTPRFDSVKPQLPIAYAGQPYVYDFANGLDIHPKYNDVPYIVELANDYNNPAWLHIENNQLIADKVPFYIKQKQTVFITIENIPGGKSTVFSLELFIMN